VWIKRVTAACEGGLAVTDVGDDPAESAEATCGVVVPLHATAPTSRDGRRNMVATRTRIME
jgi:hypothetical protein